MTEENKEKLDESIDWEKTAHLTDSDEAEVFYHHGTKWRITKDGKWPIGNVDKGIELAKQGKHEEAIAYYDTAIRSDKRIGCDEDPQILFLKATSLIKLGRDDEAKQCVDRAEELQPEPPSQ